MPDTTQLDDDLVERAEVLISCGREPEPLGLPTSNGAASVGQAASPPNDADMARMRRDVDIESTLNAYFIRLRATDIHGALGVLEDGKSASEDVRHAMQQLAAYFRWASITGITHTSDGATIEPLAARLAIALSCRLTGDPPDAVSESSALWPRWLSPDEALGWRRPSHRVADPVIEERNVTIAAMAAAREQDAEKTATCDRLVSPATVKALAQQLGLSGASIRAAIAQQADFFHLLRAKPELIEAFLPPSPARATRRAAEK